MDEMRIFDLRHKEIKLKKKERMETPKDAHFLKKLKENKNSN